jgi:hypothetical protein
VGGGLKLDNATNVSVCAAADAGVMRYNTTTKKLEVCDGTGTWKPAGSDLWLENGTHIYSGNTGNVGIGTTTPTQKLDVQGNTNISGNVVAGGTGSITGNFAVNTDALSVVAATKRVGIGKAAPAVALDVVGDAYILGNETVTANLTVDTTTLFVDAANDRVGVGSITPEYPLDIVVTSTIGALGSLDTDGAIVRIMEDAGGPGLYMDGNTIVTDGGMILGSAANFDVSLIANSLEAVRIAASGNVGIGTVTPGQKLAGSVRVSDGSRLEFGATADTSIVGNSATDVLTFNTAGAERARIDASGNVGIGDVAPNAKMVVAGGIKIGTHTTCAAGGANNGTIQYDNTIKKMQLCIDGTWKAVSSINKLDDLGDVAISEVGTPSDNDILA